MTATRESPSPPSQESGILRRGRGPQIKDVFPLPGAGEGRNHLTKMAMRWALYGDAPFKERTMDATCARLGIARGTLETVWEEDGIEIEQARQLGIKPLIEHRVRETSPAMGSIHAAEAERRRREAQQETLLSRSHDVQSALSNLPARLSLLAAQLDSPDLDPDSAARISLAIDSANKEGGRLVTELAKLNAMIAEITGLAAIQSIALSVGKTEALHAAAQRRKASDAPKEAEGRIVEIG